MFLSSSIKAGYTYLLSTTKIEMLNMKYYNSELKKFKWKEVIYPEYLNGREARYISKIQLLP